MDSAVRPIRTSLTAMVLRGPRTEASTSSTTWSDCVAGTRIDCSSRLVGEPSSRWTTDEPSEKVHRTRVIRLFSA